ncbi:late competence development ComFB family protein [Thermochromatium tepidum]|uniref:Competence protein ComFB n=1 Tax=Thermochromatium tepidum ATCC 43061 TaxID=316276 RepID=A0A6I6E9X9_THETI|nr:late competence development ComFB family protein [Thermochromatium tepidum]QGU33503.1 competence protein ComFB [Thermochromatium tepidum ATCC 43061]
MLANIQNYYEPLVMQSIRDKLSGRDEEYDADLVADLACLALNALPARYVRHTVDLWSHLGDSERAAVSREVEEAVESAFVVMRRRREARRTEIEAQEPSKTRLPWT